MFEALTNRSAEEAFAPVKKRRATPDNPFGYDEDIIRLSMTSSPTQTSAPSTTVKETIPTPKHKPVTPERMQPEFDLEKAPVVNMEEDRIEKPTPGEVASIWNTAGRDNTDEFGNDVDIIYNQKPWTQKK